MTVAYPHPRASNSSATGGSPVGTGPPPRAAGAKIIDSRTGTGFVAFAGVYSHTLNRRSSELGEPARACATSFLRIAVPFLHWRSTSATSHVTFGAFAGTRP